MVWLANRLLVILVQNENKKVFKNNSLFLLLLLLLTAYLFLTLPFVSFNNTTAAWVDIPLAETFLFEESKSACLSARFGWDTHTGGHLK